MAPCPYCGKLNQPSTGFCIHCGEPTDSESVSLHAGTLPSSSVTQTTGDAGLSIMREPEQKRTELFLGVAILVGIVGFALFFSAQQSAMSRHYRAGIEAMQKRDLSRGLGELQLAGDYLDARKLHSELGATIRRRDETYNEGLAALEKGKWWQVARLLGEVAKIDDDHLKTDALLQKARQMNGTVAYRLAPKVDGDGGLYLSYTDGSEPWRLPQSDSFALLHAFSPDARWIIYSTYNPGSARSLVLCNVVERTTYPVKMPTQYLSPIIAARFTQDASSFVVDLNDTRFTYRVPGTGNKGVEALTASEAERLLLGEIENNKEFGLYYDRWGKFTTVSVKSHGEGEGIEIDRQRAVIDGALVSPDGRYLIYRACEPMVARPDFTCTLRLADMTAAQPEPQVLVKTDLLTAKSGRWNLNAEFTRDGRHLLVVERYSSSVETRLYNLASGMWTDLGAKAGLDLASAPLVGHALPGLSGWEWGYNSLANTRRTVALTKGEGAGTTYFFARSHWITVADGGRFAVYLAGRDTNQYRGAYKLVAIPLLEAGNAGKPLLSTGRMPGEWLAYTYLLPDGYTLLSMEPPEAGDQRGLYAYDLATGESSLTVKGATDLWLAGYSSLNPDIPRFVGR